MNIILKSIAEKYIIIIMAGKKYIYSLFDIYTEDSK